MCLFLAIAKLAIAAGMPCEEYQQKGAAVFIYEDHYCHF